MTMVPSHIAIIMDGNRRWARRRGLPDAKGHEAGTDTLAKIVDAAAKIGIKTLTVYALSTENIKERAKREVLALFALLRRGFREKAADLAKRGIRVVVLGDIEGLPKKVREAIEEIKSVYIKNEAIRVNIALNYGGKAEIVRAIQNLIRDGIDVAKINEGEIDKRLYTAGQSHPDLVIRTGGMVRLSNFLLWQTAYSELYFTKKLWPDFGPTELKKAVDWYATQKRNFGK